VEIEEVWSLTLTQGAFNVTPVVDGEADALSELFHNGKQGRCLWCPGVLCGSGP
jgi:hypothetical protein